MITSLFQKLIEVLCLNGLSGSLGYTIPTVKMRFIVCPTLCLVIVSWEGIKSQKIYSQTFKHWAAEVSPYKVPVEGKKKKRCL